MGIVLCGNRGVVCLFVQDFGIAQGSFQGVKGVLIARC